MDCLVSGLLCPLLDYILCVSIPLIVQMYSLSYKDCYKWSLNFGLPICGNNHNGSSHDQNQWVDCKFWLQCWRNLTTGVIIWHKVTNKTYTNLWKHHKLGFFAEKYLYSLVIVWFNTPGPAVWPLPWCTKCFCLGQLCNQYDEEVCELIVGQCGKWSVVYYATSYINHICRC